MSLKTCSINNASRINTTEVRLDNEAAQVLLHSVAKNLTKVQVFFHGKISRIGENKDIKMLVRIGLRLKQIPEVPIEIF